MDSKTTELEGQVKTLTEEVAKLTRRLEELEERNTRHHEEFFHSIFMLTFGKLADPRAPYFAWLLERARPKEACERINALFTVLDAQRTGEEIAEYYRDRIKDEVSHDLLYRTDLPPVADIIAAIKRVARIDTTSELREFIKARDKQNSLYEEICELVLAEIDG